MLTLPPESLLPDRPEAVERAGDAAVGPGAVDGHVDRDALERLLARPELGADHVLRQRDDGIVVLGAELHDQRAVLAPLGVALGPRRPGGNEGHGRPAQERLGEVHRSNLPSFPRGPVVRAGRGPDAGDYASFFGAGQTRRRPAGVTGRARRPSRGSRASSGAGSPAGRTGRWRGAGGRSARTAWYRLHPALVRQAVALAQVAAGAGGEDVGPARPPAARAGDQVVEGQLVRRVALEAVLAAEAVAQEDVEPRERRPAVLGYVLLERHDARQLHLEAGRADHPVVVRDHRDAVEENGLDGLLPVPDRQRVVAQRLVVGVQDEGRTGVQRQHGVRPAHHGRPGIL